ncbi:DNA polymerase beta domain protein region [Microseira wollei NIES-4236]|uniref:DNA polymerase beta domain protein region n=1 Tax=Microseira wollei NIES-4236 TaxID=2530354 RepID=A0AAV3XTE2_9CYAN|nr:nucleotidyltransferase domain-containing protein [Microseira wollei]GET43317.1 DNA polymerase beta domain protein region [Microseira wollei NIES-4236]
MMSAEIQTIVERRLGVSPQTIAEFCQRWHIIEFAVFGSVLRSYFRPDSDIDVLVTFAPEAKRGWTETLQMQEELKAMFAREVSRQPWKKARTGCDAKLY